MNKYDKLSKLSNNVIKNYMIRNNKDQKEKFIDLIVNSIEKYDFPVYVENISGKNKNIVVGDILHAKFIFTAHYDTPNTLFILPNFCTPTNKFTFILYQLLIALVMVLFGLGIGFLLRFIYDEPAMVGFGITFASFLFVLQMRVGVKNKNNFNDNTSGIVTLIELIDKLYNDNRFDCAFVFFDNEEKGLKGSKEFFKNHKEIVQDKVIINFDCVGEGDNILLFKKNVEPTLIDTLKLDKEDSNKKLVVLDGKKCVYNSDHKHFPIHIGCMACKYNKFFKYYIGKIHTNFDKNLDQENILSLIDIFSNIKK